MDPIKTPHLHETEQDRIILLICSAKLAMFIHLNHKPPQSVVVMTLNETIIPPLLQI